MSTGASASGDASRGDPKEIKPVFSTSYEDLCLSRPGGLPIIEDLGPTDAVVFYYGEYQPESETRRGSRSRSVDVQLYPVPGMNGDETWEEDAGTGAKDKQPATPLFAPEPPPQAAYDIVPLDKINNAASGRSGNISWLKKDGPAHVQIPYVRSFAREDIKELFDPSSDLRYSSELFEARGKDTFISDVRVRVKGSSHNIFVGLPYLGCGLDTKEDSLPEDGLENGLKLPYYPWSNASAGGEDCGMRVWQSWHILFDNTRLALIKSPNSPGSKCAPLFGHQSTFGPLHALALIIGNLFQHEVQPLEVLRAKVNEDLSNVETEMSDYVSLEPDKVTKDVRSNYRKMMKDSNDRLKRHIFNINTIIVILEKQLSILKYLQTITTNQQHPRLQPAFSNPVPLTHFNRQGEQLKNAARVFKQLIVEREAVLADMNTLSGVMKTLGRELQGELRMVREQLQEEGMQGDLGDNMSGGTETPGGVGARNTIPTLQQTTIDMKNIMERQGQTVTCFAFITAIFLPLEFFAQYLGVIGINTNRGYWRIAGPVTVVVMMVLFGFMFWEDTNIKKGIKQVGRWLGIRGEGDVNKEKGAGQGQGGDKSAPSTSTNSNSALPGGSTRSPSPNSAVAEADGGSVTVKAGGSTNLEEAGGPRNSAQSIHGGSWITHGFNATNSSSQQTGSDPLELTDVVIEHHDNTAPRSGGGANSTTAGSPRNINQPTGGKDR